MPRTRASTDKSGGTVPNHAVASALDIPAVMVEPTLSVANIRLSRISFSLIAKSVSRL